MSKRVIMGVMVLWACGDDAPEQGTAACASLSVAECGQDSSCQLLSDDSGALRCGEERIGVRGCDVMSVEECKRDARCQTIDGREFDEDRMCMSASEPLGCQQRGATCPPAVLYARDANAKSFEFVSGCVPQGFERFQPVVPPQQTWPSCELRQGECEALTATDCASDERCMTISGRRIDEDKRCIGDAATLSCMERQGCTAALVVARDAQNQRWWFSDGCLPPNFHSSETDGPVNWPLCNPPPPATPKACAELRGDDCEAERPDCIAIQALAYEPARMCVRGPKKVGCMPRTQGCTAAISYGRDSEGQPWQFASGCQPAGFTPFLPAQGETPATSWPGCS